VTKKRNKNSSLGPISNISLGEFSQRAMHVYGTFVLMDRAVADVRDGLKPVQRRILWAMHALKKQGPGFKKSAKIVGDTMGNFHPHGDQAIYEALVKMTANSRYPLIEGHGNFGSPTDNAASMRYTEARLSPLADELFRDIDVATFVSNYSGDREEPLVLPSRIPLLLLNGSSGIGVALRASIPPHNLRELLKVLIYYITRENPSLDTVIKHMPGPDYGYGVLLSPPEEVKALYETGAGTLQFRCEYSFETNKNGSVLVVRSLAPNFDMGSFLRKMRKLSEDGLIEFCSDATNAQGVCIYVGFKDATVIKDRVLPELHTNQSYQFYVVKRNTDDEAEIGEENLFSGGLFRMFQEFLDFRRAVETARLERELKLSKALLLRAKAILAAIQNLDKVYEVLRERHLDMDAMRLRMAQVLGVSEKQAQVVLDMKVHQLARMNEDTQHGKIAEIRGDIERIKGDLNNIDGVIVQHLKELVKFSDERKMKLSSEVSSPKLSVEESEKYVIVQGMKVSRQDKEPSRRHKFELLAKGTSSVVVVLANNEAKTLPLSFVTEESYSHPPVGLLGDAATVLAAVDQQGKVVLVSPPARPSFNVMRGATGLVSAVGVVPGGYLALVSQSGRGRLLYVDSLETSRAFVRGKKLFPTAEYGTSKDKVTQLFALPPGAELFDAKGKCVTCDGNEYFEGKPGFFAIGQQNFVLVKDDRRDIVAFDDAVSLLKNGELKGCWIL
jgi:DNA gyrase/topoisomerase IV subunit A